MASTRRARLVNQPKELSIPNHFRCPMSLDLMQDPVTVSTGITYDRPSIETWLFDMGNLTCPVTNLHLSVDGPIIPNHSLRRMIQNWCDENRSNGIDRIPTPKIPITSMRATEILSEISFLVQSGGGGDGTGVRVHELAKEVGRLSKESHMNRRCLASAGSACILAALFDKFPSVEVLSTMALFCPLDYASCQLLCSKEALKSIVSVLKSGDIVARLDALMVVKDILSIMTKELIIQLVAEIDGLIEAVVDIIKKPISPRATKTAMVASYYVISLDEEMASKFAESGLVPLLLDLLLEPERGMCERALAVLNSIFSYDKGREAAYSHALTAPLLVKKMFRVSDLATDFVISSLWKLCKNYKGKEEEDDDDEGRNGILKEAIQVGAFPKVLLLLQVGCNERTKERATDLLKMMNGSKEKYDCIDTMDFKGLKKAF